MSDLYNYEVVTLDVSDDDKRTQFGITLKDPLRFGL